MRKTLIITDTCSDIPDTIKLNHTKILPLSFYFAGERNVTYEDLKIYSNRDFYNRLNCGIVSKILPIEYNQALSMMINASNDGYDIICVHVGKSISFENYMILKQAKDLAQLNNIDLRVTLIDSETTSMGEGLLVYKADKMVSDGYSYEEIVDYLNKYKKSYTFDFCPCNEDYLSRSKIIKSTKINVNQLLNLKSIYSMNSKGIYIKKIMKTGVNSSDAMIENMMDSIDETEPIVIMHANNQNGAEYLADAIEELNWEKYIAEIDKVNGSLFGPYTLGLAYKKK